MADGLSRKVQCVCKLSVSKWQSTLLEKIKLAADQDVEYQQIKQQVQQLSDKEIQKGYELDDA